MTSLLKFFFRQMLWYNNSSFWSSLKGGMRKSFLRKFGNFIFQYLPKKEQTFFSENAENHKFQQNECFIQ